MTREAMLLGLAHPAAAREQGDIIDLDYQLTRDARERHPAARWWWGERVVAGTNGALCYLCDKLIVSWYRAFPTPAVAIDAILAHRADHLDGRITHSGTTTAGTSPAADAPPMEGQQ